MRFPDDNTDSRLKYRRNQEKTFPRGAAFCGSLLLALASALALLAERPVLADTDRLSGAERELCELYLAVIEDAVDVFDPLWREDPRVPKAGFFDFREYDDWVSEVYPTAASLPGNGMLLLDHAVLLKETDREVFGKRELSRAQLLDRAVQAIRWICLTSAYVENPYPYLRGEAGSIYSGKQWKREIGRRGDSIGYLTLAVALLWEDLDEETRSLFRAVATGGALRERIKRTWRSLGGGNHDQVKQDLSSTFGAAFLFDGNQDADGFLARVTESGIDMVSTLADRTKTVVAEGQPIKQWARGWNLYEDCSSDHHGHAQLFYGGDMLFEGRCYVDIMACLTGRRVPETYTYDGNNFDGVLEWLKTLCLAEGGLAHPHGAEYDSYYGAGLLAFCYGATVKQDRVASTLEHQAAKLLARHTRAVRKYDGHRGSWAKAAMAYLMHKYHGPAAEPMQRDLALRALEGTSHYRNQRCFIHRTPEKWASFSWGSATYKPETDKPFCRWPPGDKGLCGVLVPQEPDKLTAAPLAYCHPHSLTGQIRNHSLRCATFSLVRRALSQLLGSSRRRLYSAAMAGVLALAASAFLVFKRIRRRWVLYVVLGLATGLLLTCCVSIVRAARQGISTEITDIQYEFTRSDDALSTAGSATCGGVRRHQAFFSFAEGPCATLLALRGQQNTEVSWSGLPVYCYVRPGITDEHECRYEQGVAPAGKLGDVESTWWCVGDRLGMAAVGGTGRIRGGKTVGYNWCRKDSYKDQADFVTSSALDHVAVKATATLVDLGAVFYVDRPYEEVRDCSARVRDISDRLPHGWKGLTAPISADRKARILALANLYGRETTTRLRLSFPEGAPILTKDSLIDTKQARTEIQLGPLESFGESLQWYVEVTEGGTIHARRTAFDRVELTVSEDEAASVRLRYAGRTGERILLKDRSGHTIREVPVASARDPGGVEIRVREYLRVELHGEEVIDTIGPAVEITAIEARPDGSLRVRVLANDRSGVRQVELYCDGLPLSQGAVQKQQGAVQKQQGAVQKQIVGGDSVGDLLQPGLLSPSETPPTRKSARLFPDSPQDGAAPLEWTCKPGAGWHTFMAVATDASPNGNVSNSFSRTIVCRQ